jgi:uncharacterized protein YjbI with pentapeptide repeats
MKYENIVMNSVSVHSNFGHPPDLSNQKFISVRFIDVDLRGANVRGAHFHDVEFINCRLDGVDFSQARVTGNSRLPGDTTTDGPLPPPERN